MAGNLQPLDEKFAIVGPDGRPTLYFIQWAQQKQIDIQGAITEEQFNELLLAYLLAHPLQEGSGINLTPSGNISDSPTISADVQEILDQITNVHGSILYRDSAAWAALAPGTAGQFLKTNGPGADPEWAAGGGGGGGALSMLQQIVVAAPTATLDFSGIPADAEDLILVISGRGTDASVGVAASIRFNNDSGANYDYSRWNRFGNVSTVAQTSGQIGTLMAATAPAGNPSQFEILIANYARGTYRKTYTGLSSGDQTTAAAGQFGEFSEGLWRNVAAINRVTVLLSAGNFDVGTVATLYQRKAVGGGGGGGGGMALLATSSPSGTGTVTFSSIPATYKDLRLVVSGRSTNAAASVPISLRFNNDSGNNYDDDVTQLNNTTITNFAHLAQAQAYIGNLVGAGGTANLPGVTTLDIFNYAGTTFQKDGLYQAGMKRTNAVGSMFTERGSIWWRNTAAINRIDVLISGNFEAGSLVSLYGIG